MKKTVLFSIFISLVIQLLGLLYSTTEEKNEGFYVRHYGFPARAISVYNIVPEQTGIPIKLFPPNYTINLGLIINFWITLVLVRAIIKYFLGLYSLDR